MAAFLTKQYHTGLMQLAKTEYGNDWEYAYWKLVKTHNEATGKNVPNKVLAKLRKIASTVYNAMIKGISESSRKRTVIELTKMGYYKEAEQVRLGNRIDD